MKKKAKVIIGMIAAGILPIAFFPRTNKLTGLDLEDEDRLLELQISYRIFRNETRLFRK